MTKLLGFVLIILSACSGYNYLSPRPESATQFSILQGSTDAHSTVIRVVYPKKLDVKYEVRDRKNIEYRINKIKTYKKKYSNFAVDHLYITGLEPTKEYRLEAGSTNFTWKDIRKFKTFDHSGDKLKFLVVSCINDMYNEVGNAIWPKAIDKKPELMFFIGDNVYADVFSGVYLGALGEVTPEHLWQRYVDHAMVLWPYRMKELIPTYAVWDDHDFGPNDGNKSYRYKKESKEILEVFFPRKESKNYQLGPGVSSKLISRKMSFHFLDNRSFRDARDKKNGKHLGTKQRIWLMDNLKEDFNWLVLGGQFFGAYHQFESFAGNHPEMFRSFITELNRVNKRYVFLSGDRHLVEEMEIPSSYLGYPSYEFTVSGMQTKMFKGSLERSPNKLRVNGFDGVANYGIFKTEVGANEMKIIFQAYSINGLKFSSQRVIVK